MKLEGQMQKSLIEQVEEVVAKLPFEEQELLTRFTHFHRVMMEPWRNGEEKLRYWLASHPGRAATHEAIGEEIGMSRETVTRTLESAHRNYTENGWVLGHRD